MVKTVAGTAEYLWSVEKLSASESRCTCLGITSGHYYRSGEPTVRGEETTEDS